MRRALRLLSRGVRLRCPRCGERTLFRGWFAMHERCSACGLRFAREPGYFLGAMYINYGVAVLVAVGATLALAHWAGVPPFCRWSCGCLHRQTPTGPKGIQGVVQTRQA
ncbi:MAG: hypothetical protein KatS3mg131_2322 [Candidatus Tectimicrobiota bacterium]|nr:MAG: hypothetical protein KatS3mg131_2322 [Candidatus Tectomicrobia bacterium]